MRYFLKVTSEKFEDGWVRIYDSPKTVDLNTMLSYLPTALRRAVEVSSGMDYVDVQVWSEKGTHVATVRAMS